MRAGGLEHLINSLIPHACRDMVSVNAAACLINMSAEISVRFVYTSLFVYIWNTYELYTLFILMCTVVHIHKCVHKKQN